MNLNARLRECLQPKAILRLILAALILAAIGFGIVFWWTAPVYLAGVVALSDIRIDGTPIDAGRVELHAGKNYAFSCVASGIGKRFVIADSGNAPYLEPMPMFPESQHEVPQDRFDPTFGLAFANDLRLGRPVLTVWPTRVKTNGDGESVLLQQHIRTPSKPGRYRLHLLWFHNPDGFVQIRPDLWTQRSPKNDPILWQQAVYVVRAK